MSHLSPSRTGLALGGLFAVLHLVWAILVAAGSAQFLLNWIFRLHFLTSPFTVTPFDLLTAAILVVVTFIVGLVVGWAFALVWNGVHSR